jgi:enhancer of mRNA-decapping protein 4
MLEGHYMSKIFQFIYRVLMCLQLIAMQKQLSTVVIAPIAKEGKRIETSLGRTMEKSIKASIDALWARFLEENTKHEKAERERMQQMTTLITSSISKDLPAMLEKSLKKEVSALGPVVARTVTPIIEKSLASIIADSVQVVPNFLLYFSSSFYHRCPC